MFWLLTICEELQSLLRREEAERGQDMVEYGLLIALLALASSIAITAGGTAISNVFWTIWNTFTAAIAAAA